MSDGLTTDLVLIAAITAIVSAWIASRDLPPQLSVVLAVIRVGVPLIYFAEYFNPVWSITDDLVYFARGSELLRCGYDPVSIVADPQGWDYLFSISQGHHILYAWWNLLALWLFGEHYYAPIFCNIVVMFLGGSLLVRMLAQLGFSPGYRLGLHVFWLLHWDAIAWSSFLNVKDVLVQTLTIAILFSLVSFVCQRKLRYLVALGITVQLLWWIRFYVPLLVLVAAMLWMLTQWNDVRRYVMVPLAALAFYFALPTITGASDYWRADEALYGAVRFCLTPTPWNLQPTYDFLSIPTLMHWLFFLPALVGAVCLWRDSVHARLFIVYLVCLVGLYSITQELLGTRQRFQVAFLFAWLQFHFLWVVQPSWVTNSLSSRSGWAFRAWPAMAAPVSSAEVVRW